MFERQARNKRLTKWQRYCLTKGYHVWREIISDGTNGYVCDHCERYVDIVEAERLGIKKNVRQPQRKESPAIGI